MASRQDQLHSYQFTVQRAVAALVMRETDPPQSPFRRLAGAGLASVLVAAIALGGVALYGLFTGGGDSWRETGAVIVEKESGARFVYRDEKLHPVLNYASALLIIGAEQPKTVLVGRRAIEGVPRGLPLGIADAPDSLPVSNRLVRDAWTLCSVPGDDTGRGEAVRGAPRSVLLIGRQATGGRALGDQGLLARHPDGGLHLLWHDRRYLLRDTDRVLAALAATRERAVPVAAALLNTLPAGADLAPPPVDDLGEPSERVTGASVGDVYLVRNSGGGRQYAVAQRGGLAGITELQAALLLARTGQGEPEPITLGRFAALPKLPGLVPGGPTAPPAVPPRLAAAENGAVCALAGDDAGVREIRVGVTAPDLAAATRTPGGRAGLADEVVVEPGRGALVEAVSAPGATGGTVCVVTDLGRRYALTGADVPGMLGYAGVRPARLPAGLVDLLPAGSPLDPEAARTVAAPA
ncbi:MULTISPECIES: type VII secretion protein EccB [unclassified Micromonospora]|uniref:type VII secretion protein EccB n=1 Tax=unclassified Micromonospora TaxID=2617518 RepID=UPI0022B6154B|nr:MULTISPECIES: type VII secretion protein EccB [unclassified Micromonospora]MCZ7475081.1 type VII secretion protein EccB [Micromonospora sp. WMMC273]WBC05701.1 type VII secretion protein EccB [Micromonospora sp. WMMA1976]